MGKKSKSIRTRKTNPEDDLAKQAAKEERAVVAARMKKQSDEDMRPDTGRKMMRIFGDEPDEDGMMLPAIATTSPLPPEHLPVQHFTTMIPVIVWETDQNPHGKAVRPGPLLQHLRPSTAVSVVCMMTPGGVRQKWGDKVLGCMNEAIDNLGVEGGVLPMKSPPEAYRHGLGLIIINQVGGEMPDIPTLLTPFYEQEQRYEHPVLKALIDPSCFDEKIHEVALAVAMRSWQKDDKRVHTVVIILILVGSMDIWHSANPCSPGDKKLFSQLRKRVAKKKATACGGGEQMKGLEGVVPMPAPRTEEEIALDEEFSELDFESLLAEEKGAGPLSF